MGSTGDGAFPAWLQFPRLCLSSETLDRSHIFLVISVLINSQTNRTRFVRSCARSSFARSLHGRHVRGVQRYDFDRASAIARVDCGFAIDRFRRPRFVGADRLGSRCGSRQFTRIDACWIDLGARSCQSAASWGRPNNSLEATAASSGVFCTWVRLGMRLFQRGCSSRGCASALRRSALLAHPVTEI